MVHHGTWPDQGCYKSTSYDNTICVQMGSFSGLFIPHYALELCHEGLIGYKISSFVIKSLTPLW